MITPSQSHTLRVLVTCISSISMISGAAVVLCFLWFREVEKSYSSQILFMMIVSDMLSSMAWVLTPANTNATVCTLQAFFIQMFDVSAFFWTACVALNAWLRTTRQHLMSRRQLIMCHIVCWGVPLFMAVYCISRGLFEQQDKKFISWCWIEGEYIAYRMLFYYGPLVSMWIFTASLYFWLLYKFHLTRNSGNNTAHRRATRMILSFMAAFIGCKFFALVNRLQNAIDENNPIFVLMILQGATDPLRGFTDCVVYTFAKVRARLRARLMEAQFGYQEISSPPQ
eukprot:Phypoly_transcript_13796.p1 GENE.Phypoly_transcript_13796~~Phypoly_transcript_13796.p1  ORF type:complete len:283 (+),score=18.66 Phypoly_transcript_13796:140-988(+)